MIAVKMVFVRYFEGANHKFGERQLPLQAPVAMYMELIPAMTTTHATTRWS